MSHRAFKEPVELKLEGWPPTSIWRTDGNHQNRRVLDHAARGQWESMREQAMFAWTGKEVQRCCVDITYVGARSKVQLGPMTSSLLHLLERAGVISGTGPEDIVEVCLRSRRGPIQRTEIRFLPPTPAKAPAPRKAERRCRPQVVRVSVAQLALWG